MDARSWHRRWTAATLVAPLALAACGGSDPVAPPPPPPPPPVSVVVAPGTAQLGAGGTQQFTATVSNTTNTGVTWTTSGGTITGTGNTVTYTAPVAGGSYGVTATSVADATKSGAANVTVTAVAVTLAPTTAILYRWEPRTFTATVTGLAAGGETGVTWTVSCGEHTSDGNTLSYAAPGTAGECTITATSAADPTKSASATVTVRAMWLVTATDDATDGDGCTWSHCSLREALLAANANPDPDGIQLGAGLAGTITLTSALPSLTTPISIGGPGAEHLTINANATIADPRPAFTVSGGANVGISGLRLVGGVNNAGGGIQVVGGSTVQLVDLIIEDNLATVQGGGLFMGGASSGSLHNLIVRNNRTTGAAHPGGGISVTGNSILIMLGGSLTNNEVADGWAGAIRALDSRLVLDGVTIANNRTLAGTGGGGGVLAEGEAQLSLLNSTITGNTTVGPGGGVRLLGHITGYSENSTVTGNTAHSAGGLEIGNTSSLTMVGSTVSGNTTSNRAGGILLWGGAALRMTGGAVSDNTANGGGGGGGLYTQDLGLLELDGVTVSGNRTTGTGMLGGGIFVGHAMELAIKNSTIANNTVTNGSGAGLAVFGEITIATLDNVTISGNIVQEPNGGGGGLFMGDGAPLTMIGGVVRDNATPQGAGAGVFVQSGTLQLTGTTIRNNTALIQGGGIIALGQSVITMDGATVAENHVTGTGVINALTAGLGGGIAIFNETQLTVTNSTIAGNTAAGFGGGIYKLGPSTVSLVGTTVADNTAESQGGGLHILGMGGLTIDRSTIRGNTALTNSGGGITTGIVGTITNSTFSGNTSAGTGGGIFSSGTATTTITNTTLSGNSAAIGGGLGVTGVATLRNVTIVGNTASDFGAGIASNNAGAPTLTSVLLSGNQRAGVAQNCATGGGAGINSGGGNLSDDATCAALSLGSDKPNTPAGVAAALANNGGPTLTHALLDGSAAINAGQVAGCPTTDQRGAPRVGACDIGGFEFGGTPPAVAAVRAASPAAIRRPGALARARVSAPATDPSRTIAPVPAPLPPLLRGGDGGNPIQR